MKQNIKKHRKLFIALGIIFAVITITVSILIQNVYYYVIPVTDMMIEDIALSQSEQTFSVWCYSWGSALVYRNYNYYIENDKLYITIKGGLVGLFPDMGTKRIIIEDERISTVTEVFIKDKNETMLIYSLD